MKRLLLLLSFLIFNCPLLLSQTIPYDKQLHYSAGVMVGYPTAVFSYYYTENTAKTFAWTMGTTILVGGGKELIYDKWMNKGTPDVKDFLWTVGGGLTGFGIVRLLAWNDPKLRKLERNAYVSCTRNGVGIVIRF